MTKDLTPEERLLSLIKGAPKEDKPFDGAEQLPKPEAQDLAAKEIPPVSNRLVGRKEQDPFKLAVFFLTALLVIGTVYFIKELSRKEEPVINIERLIQPQEKKQPGQEPATEAPSELKEETQQEAPPQTRQLFGAPVTRETAPVAEQGPSIAELVKDLSLLGVVTGSNTQAIIQDKKTHQTFYVSEGEDILEFKVKKIEKAVVILERNGETIKLSL